MTEYEILRSPRWTAKWTCQVCGEENIRHKADVLPGIDSPEDLADHLNCGICQSSVTIGHATVQLSPDHL